MTKLISCPCPRSRVRSHLHMMELPHRIMIGQDVLRLLGKFIEMPRSAGIVVASGLNVQQRVREVVAASLEGRVSWVDVRFSDMKNVRSVMRASRDAKCIIGLGGGKSVDVGKLAASKLNLPFFSVPTSASHDGIAGPVRVDKGDREALLDKVQAPAGDTRGRRRHRRGPTKALLSGLRRPRGEADRGQGLAARARGERGVLRRVRRQPCNDERTADNRQLQENGEGRHFGRPGPRRGPDQHRGGGRDRGQQQALQRLRAPLQPRA